MASDMLQVVAIVISALTLVVVALLWRHIDKRAGEQRGFETRLAKVEAQQAAVITPVEVRQIFEQLAAMKASVATLTTLMQTIQDHLVDAENKRSDQ